MKLSRLFTVILSTVLLSVPALAWFSMPVLINPTVSSGGGGTGGTCVIGVNYTGSIPAGATAAGMTKCAMNLDFSQSFFATLSNWLDCAGAGAASLLFNNNVNGQTVGCSAYSMVTDSGGQVLLMRIPPGTGDFNASLFTIAPNNLSGQLFPANQYIEFRYRVGVNNFSQCVAYGCDFFQFFITVVNGTASNVPYMPFNWMEVYSNASFASAQGQSCDGLINFATSTANGSCVPTVGFNAGGTGGALVADQTVMHTYAVRVVTDGASDLVTGSTGNLTQCIYLDTTQKACQKFTYNNHTNVSQDMFAMRQQLNIQNVWCPVLNACNTSKPLTGNQDVFIDHITIWECPAWVKTGVTQPGTDVCLNTTADVTGRLAGLP